MRATTVVIVSWLLLAFAPPATAALNVFACEPEWAELVRVLGGPQVEATSATTALQDPHHIEARPSLIARARRADLVVCTGAGLEAGWLPLLLRSAGNARIQPGQPGYFEAAAEKAFRAARFTPGMKHGRPVRVQMLIEVAFDSPPPPVLPGEVR